VPQGADIARRFDAPLILLRVLPSEKEFEDAGPEPDPQRAEFSADVLGRREYDSLRAQAEGYLESIKKSLRSSGVAVETRLEEGKAAGAILRVANSLELPWSSSRRMASLHHSLPARMASSAAWQTRCFDKAPSRSWWPRSRRASLLIPRDGRAVP
jgi:hypothetical protein